MNGPRFDALTQAFAGQASRRRALGVAVAAALTPFATIAASEPAKCVPLGRRCRLPASDAAGHGKGKRKGGKGKHHRRSCEKCCSRSGSVGADGKARCACKGEAVACDNDVQCCSGQCRGNVCTACPPPTVFCADGCADLQTNQDHCGSCEQACDGGQRCQGGQCVCGERSCSFGCCDGTICRRGTGDEACGTGGGACQRCDAGQRCNGERCVCDPTGCSGCCQGDACQSGTENGACGAGGVACAVCAAPDVCHDQACCTPDCAHKCGGGDDGCGGTCDGVCAAGRICLSNGTCAVPCPNGGDDCTSAGCANRCLETNQGNVCTLGDSLGSCDHDNAQCPTGRACGGELCEVVC